MLCQSILTLRQHHFDWVIDLQSLARSGIFAWLSNGGLTIGLDDAREGARGFYDIAVRRASWHTHAVDWYLAVLPHLKVPFHKDFIWLPPRPKVVAEFQQKWHPPEGRRFVLVPGARWNNKRWPAESYAELVRRIRMRENHAFFVILGSKEDQALGQTIAAVAPEHCRDLTGKTNLAEMIEWIRWGEIMVTNDTGPMHVAAALGRPIVALLGPTEPRRTGPYGQLNNVLQSHLPCVPCMKGECAWPTTMECLRSIPPEAVVNQIVRLMQPTNPLHLNNR